MDQFKEDEKQNIQEIIYKNAIPDVKNREETIFKAGQKPEGILVIVRGSALCRCPARQRSSIADNSMNILPMSNMSNSNINSVTNVHDAQHTHHMNQINI